MPILVHFRAKNNENSYFYKNSGLSFPWVPYYLKSNLEFRYQIKVSSVKFRNGFVKLMIPIALFKKFLS